MGTFVFRWPYPADHVYVTGTFDDWGKSEKLDKVGEVFEKEVHLSNVNEKIYYKFVVDNNWIVDDQAPKEDDGHYNINNVLLPSQIKKDGTSAGAAATTGKDLTKPFTALAEAPIVSAGGVGAPLLSRELSEKNAARQIPHVTPDPNRPVTRTLPQTDGASASKQDDSVPGAFPNDSSNVSVAPLPATGHKDIQSSVTTSKEDYEKAGGVGTATDGDVSVDPIPATGHGDTKSSVTTSKEDYEKAGGEGTAGGDFSVKPVPATGFTDTQSSVTTSKEDYEKAGAFGVVGAAIGGAGAAIASAFSKPKSDDKNIIPESSLPMNPDKTDTLDAGPIINSSGPGTTTADLASKVPLEPKREAQVIDSSETSASPFINSSGPGTTTADLAAKVPVVDDVPSDVAAEKTAVEKELLSKVPESQAGGESASSAKAQTSYYGLATSVPEPVEESIAQAKASPEAATEASVVAEKSEVERELTSKVAVVDSAGEPAPTISAATTTTAPDATTSTTKAADSVTDGKTANEPVPGTDTSTQSGLSAGEIAGGAAVGGTAAAGAATLAAKHESKTAEPARVEDASKPDVTSEAAPATQVKEAGKDETHRSTGRDESPMTKTGEASAAGKSATSAAPVTPKKTTTGTAASTPAKSTPESSTTGDKKKKRHRLSTMIKKIFD